jgi:hypothetical protein
MRRFGKLSDYRSHPVRLRIHLDVRCVERDRI